ncbi:MAG: hypothetical protein H0T49_10345 [Chloroflexia bacterium]|nr:hypothetical protein [Chloroflexia bacterium]
MPGRITVLGLGPGNPALRTIAAELSLQQATRIILRTTVHPGLEDLADDPRVTSCDDLYESLPTFSLVYDAIANRVVAAARETDVVFAVPGHPRFGESSVTAVFALAAQFAVSVNLIEGISAVDAIITLLGIDPIDSGVQLLDGTACVETLHTGDFRSGMHAVDPSRPCLINQVYSSSIASAVKLSLMRYFPDTHPVSIIQAASAPGLERIRESTLFELDHQSFDHLTSVWIPALTPLTDLRSIKTLQWLVALLRSPGGCAWDRKQTHTSLRDALIEESYEVLDAVDAGDGANLQEELGDLLLQVIMHAQIAEEMESFVFADILESVNAKLIRRHPHVFGDAVALTPEQVVETWNAVKAQERNGHFSTPGGESNGIGLPRSASALSRVARQMTNTADADSNPLGDDEALQLGNDLLNAVDAIVRRGGDPDRMLFAALQGRGKGVADSVIHGVKPT